MVERHLNHVSEVDLDYLRLKTRHHYCSLMNVAVGDEMKKFLLN